MINKIKQGFTWERIVLILIIAFGLSSFVYGVNKSLPIEPIPQVITYKPAIPKVVRHQWFYDSDEMDAFIGKCIRDGYHVNQPSLMPNESGFYGAYVIAEKY